MLRQGQRVNFVVDDNGLATQLSLGSEIDMGTPGFLEAHHSAEPVTDPD